MEVGWRTTPPSVRCLDPVRVQPIGAGVYHGGGLCPSGMALIRAKFALPSVCHQPTGWSIRRLLPVERWNVRDVPWRVAKLTREMGENDELRRFEALLPGRCLEQGLRELLKGYGLMTEGGVLVFRSVRKRAHSEGVSEEEEEAKQRQGKRLQEEVADYGNPQSASTGKLPGVLDEPEEVADFGNTQSSSTGGLAAVQDDRADSSACDEYMGADEEEKIRNLQKSLEGLKVVDGSDEARADISEAGDATVDVKATKADDAAVRVGDWDRRLCHVMNVKLSPKAIQAAVTLRKFCLGWYRRKVTQSYFWWLHHSPKFQQCGIGMSQVVELDQCWNPQEGCSPPTDVYRWTERGNAMYCDWWGRRFKRHRKEFISARDVIRRFCDASWWDWDGGSRPVHWKWPKWYQSTIQYGLPIWFREAPKQWRRPQRGGSTEAEHEQMVKKLAKVRERRYVEPGEVTSLTSFFAVPKGTEDIRMVYDGTKSGLNKNI